MVQVTLSRIILGRRKEEQSGEELQRSTVEAQMYHLRNFTHPNVNKNIINSKECTHSSGFLVDFHVKPETETRRDFSRSQQKLDLMETRWWKIKELPASWKTTKTSWKPMREETERWFPDIWEERRGQIQQNQSRYQQKRQHEDMQRDDWTTSRQLDRSRQTAGRPGGPLLLLGWRRKLHLWLYRCF